MTWQCQMFHNSKNKMLFIDIGNVSLVDILNCRFSGEMVRWIVEKRQNCIPWSGKENTEQ